MTMTKYFDQVVPMADMPVSILTAALVGCGGVLFLVLRKYKRVEQDPMMAPSADMGTLPYLKNLLSTRGPQFLLDVARDVGYVSRAPGLNKPNWFLVGDPKVARKILENPNHPKPLRAYEVFNSVATGESFFATSGHRANHVRKSTSAAFSPQNVQRMGTIVENVLEEWIEKRLEPIFVQQNKSFDMDDEMIVLTSDVIARAAFDYIMSDEERWHIAMLLRRTMTAYFSQGLNPFKRFLPFMFAELRVAKREAKELHQFALRLIRSCRDKGDAANKNTVVYMMINDDQYVDDNQRGRDIMLYFFGGFETTAHSIAWTMLELGRHPKEQEWLRLALQEFEVANKNENLIHCPTLKHVTREILRLHTPASLGSVRLLDEEIVVKTSQNSHNSSLPKMLEQTIRLPKGSFASMPFYIILRNHYVFGDDADLFVPRRWENPTKEMQEAYMPFAVGRRNCQGQALANLELLTVVAKLAKLYHVEVEEEGEPHYMVALRPKGAKLVFTRVES